MIQELINYTQHLKENIPLVFEQNLEPSKGLHIFIEFDEQGNVKNFPGERGKQWEYYDGAEMSSLLNDVLKFEQEGTRIGTNMNKVFDKKKQIVTCSPFIVSFKKEKLDNDKLEGIGAERITKLYDYYFEKAIEECIDNNEVLTQKIIIFAQLLKEITSKIAFFGIAQNDLISHFQEMKKDCFITFYLKGVDFEDYKVAHDNYLKRNLFNKNDFNTDKIINNESFGLSDFYNGLNAKKPFLEHKTATMFKGIASRIKANDTIALNDFSLLLRRKVFPQPLPIFIDKNEFFRSEQILNIFKEDGRINYSQILKRIFKENDSIVLRNYYLLFFNYKHELEDFDYVTKFRFSLEENNSCPEIRNLFGLMQNKELKPTETIKHIFHFEATIVAVIFNGALVKIGEDTYNVHYFGEIKPEFVSGGEPVYQMVMKYRKAFYDYIYKSKIQAINAYMLDEIMWNSIIADLRNDKLTEKGHSKNYIIKQKLNIWFSLYNYFNNNQLKRVDMASKIPELIKKMKSVANNNEEVLDTVEEFAFAAGQIIYFLLNQSKASERTHALLEPFLQKVQIVQLQNSIAQMINTYKHEISFGKGRFERLSAEVLAFESGENLKNYQRLLLAGYFAPAAIYEKTEKIINE